MTFFHRNYTVHLNVLVKCASSYLCLCGVRLCPGQDTVLIRRTAVERYRSQRKSAAGGLMHSEGRQRRVGRKKWVEGKA